MKTLAEKFISVKLNSFKEHSRVGSKRGESLGIQIRIKYHAILLHALFKQCDHKTLAEMFGSTPAYVNAYMHNPAPQRTINEIQAEFAKLVVHRLQVQIDSHVPLYANQEFSDAQNYHNDVIKLVAKQIEAQHIDQKLSVLYVILWGSKETKDKLDRQVLQMNVLNAKESLKSGHALKLPERMSLIATLEDVFGAMVEGRL